MIQTEPIFEDEIDINVHIIMNLHSYLLFFALSNLLYDLNV